MLRDDQGIHCHGGPAEPADVSIRHHLTDLLGQLQESAVDSARGLTCRLDPAHGQWRIRTSGKTLRVFDSGKTPQEALNNLWRRLTSGVVVSEYIGQSVRNHAWSGQEFVFLGEQEDVREAQAVLRQRLLA